MSRYDVVPEGSFGDRFIAFRNGNPIEQIVCVSAVASISEALGVTKAREAEFGAEHDRMERAAKRRHKWAAAKRAYDLELKEIQDKIEGVPAEGLNGPITGATLPKSRGALNFSKRSGPGLGKRSSLRWDWRPIWLKNRGVPSIGE